MNKDNLNRFTVGLALGAGVLDFTTGHGLLYAPDFTLRLMRVAPLSSEALIYLRMIGAFVSAEASPISGRCSAGKSPATARYCARRLS